MENIILNEDNFMAYAISHYKNPQCRGLSELEEDLNRFKYLKRLFSRYQQNGEIRERLIINHLVILYNVFGVESATRMLFFKTDKEHWPVLKTFLVFLNYMPTEVISDKRIRESDIELDMKVIDILRKI